MKTTSHDPEKRILIIFSVLMFFNGLSLSYGAIVSSDARGLLPIDIVVHTFVAYMYAVSYVAAVRESLLGSRFLLAYHTATGLSLLLLTILFYEVNIDWLSINKGQSSLTYFQELIRNGTTRYKILGSFLIIAIIISRVRTRKKVDSEFPPP